MSLWQISENTFDPKKLHSRETVYTIGNGYFGTRGTFEEGYPRANPATLLFGVFDRIDIGKEELANAPDWVLIKLFVNGERFRLDQGKILHYQRTLDMEHGVLHRTVQWESPGGARIEVTSERFASLADEHVGAIRYSVTALEPETTGENIEVGLWSSFNLAVGNYDLMHWEDVEQRYEDELIWFHTQTRHSAVQLAQTMSFTTEAPDFRKHLVLSDIAPSTRLYGELAPGKTVVVEKVVVMYTSRDVDDPVQAALAHHREIINATPAVPEPDKHYIFQLGGTTEHRPCVRLPIYEMLLEAHKQAWLSYWQISDVVIEGDDKAQQAVRFNIYQLRISASSHDSRYSIAAKGLTGFGYHGHVFHDTEIFMLPYYVYVHPGIARLLLIYRYRTLPAARAKAKRNGYEGAQYAWESTLDGTETTPDAIVHPESSELIAVLNGPLEIHISASIAHAIWQYWRVTGDDDFMRDYLLVSLP